MACIFRLEGTNLLYVLIVGAFIFSTSAVSPNSPDRFVVLKLSNCS
ncbi:MAG TPA: hypothetical protein VN278_05055 [Methanosarcina sp.]|nr:hypothetical protein [Methanosarcina sp.]